MINGWKSVIAYLLLSIVQVIESGSPMLVNSLKFAASSGDILSIIDAVLQLLLALGIGHRAIKNVKKADS
jgi:hypothetical protein